MKHAANLLPFTLLAVTVGCSGGSKDSGSTTGTDTSGTSASTTGSDASTTTTDGTSAATTTDGGATTTGGGGPGSCSLTGTTMVTATEAMNYTFSSTLSFPPVTVQPDTELTFDWSGQTRDFLGHDVDISTEINTLNLMLWTLTQDELEQKLNDDSLTQADLAVIATYHPEGGSTSAALFDFLTAAGAPVEQDMILPFVNVDNYPPEENTYTIMTATGEVLGAGTRMIQAFKLDPNSTNTDVSIGDDSTVLDYSVNLHDLQSIPVPLGDASIVLDWDGIMTNGLGQPFVKTNVTKIAIARYSSSPTELETDFLSLVNYDGSVIADQLWEADVPSGSCMSLADLTDDTGGAFPGIDADSTWMVALFCGNCRNPAPWFLSFLTPG